MTEIRPTLPFHLARAYATPVRATPAASPPAAAPAAPVPPARPVSPVARLVAARVPGGIDFTPDAPEPNPQTLLFYNHPAARNAAATAIDLGRAIDRRG